MKKRLKDSGQNEAPDVGQRLPINTARVTRFAEIHYDEIFRYCARKLPSPEDAKDATQEVFLRLVRTDALYEHKEKPLAYLYTCARNVCIDYMRRSRPVSVLEEADAERIADPAQSGFQDKIAMADALSRLSSEEQEVLELRYGQDLKMADVSAILGLSRFALYRVERKALGKLKQMMGDDHN